jgi:hypothetical protein
VIYLGQESNSVSAIPHLSKNKARAFGFSLIVELSLFIELISKFDILKLPQFLKFFACFFFKGTLYSLYKANDCFIIVKFDNILAFNTMQAVKSLGLSIPRDIGIVTFDNYPIAEYIDPALTVIDVDTFRLGEEAAEIVLKKIQGAAVVNQYTLLSTTLIPRNSSARERSIP